MNEKLYDIVGFGSLNELCTINNIDESDILGNIHDLNNKFEAIILKNSDYKCGIVYYDHGIKPKVMIEKNNDAFFIGFNKYFYYIDIADKKILYKKELSSLFYDLIEVTSQFSIIIICELDVYIIHNSGEILWSVGFRDIVVDYYVHDDKLFIKCDDGDETTFLIKDGSVVK